MYLTCDLRLEQFFLKLVLSLSSSLNRLRELLESPHLDVRLSAGEALAVIFELGRDFSTDYEQDWALDLIEILKELATDSNKYRAKKDRKQQRANFRDILRYIEVSCLLFTRNI